LFCHRLKIPEFPPKLIFLLSEIFTDAVGIAIVSFAINISMAKMFAKKYKYEISPNQVRIIFLNFQI